MKRSKVEIVKDLDNEVTVEVFEQAIVDIAKGFQKWNNSRLSKRAIVLLVQDAVGTTYITKRQVEAVLDAAADLDKKYLKKK